MMKEAVLITKNQKLQIGSIISIIHPLHTFITNSPKDRKSGFSPHKRAPLPISKIFKAKKSIGSYQMNKQLKL